MEHEDIPLGEIHVAHNWEFANAADREAAGITSSGALKRLALQLDDNSMWMLVGVSPLVWVPVGGAAKADATDLVAHTGDTNNPHGVTKAQVGLSNVDNTSDENKPVSTAQAAADALVLSQARDYADSKVVSIFRDRGNYDASSDAFPSAGGSGVGGAIQTGDLWNITVAGTLGGEAVDPRQTVRALVDDPGQTAGNWAIGLASADIEDAINDGVTGRAPSQNAVFDALALKASVASLSAHTDNTSNPHSVTKAQIGLGNVDNTSDANKPISAATQTALNAKADAADLASHTSDTGNPHGVTKSQVGLGNVDNTSDENKPVSTAQQAAIDAKEPTIAAGTTAQYWRGDKSWQVLNATAVGLGNVDNTSDANKPISTATQAALDAKAGDAALSAHTSNTSNPHGVTKDQVGLSNVDNTSDADKPVSTAMQTALDEKATVAALAAHTGDMNNPHGVDKSDVGLGNVDNTSDINKPVSTAQAAADTATLNASKAYTDQQVVGIFRDRGNYDASSNAYPSSGGSGTAGAIRQGDLWTITVAGTLGGESVDPRQTVRALVDNPGQTASNWAIGLANTDIEDAINDGVIGRAPSQNAVYDALALKASTASLTAHTGATNNPHSVTKAQVGLGNVDNTSDLNKPISTATQTALNAKESTIAAGSTLQYWRGDKTWASFAASVRGAVLTGLDTTVNAIVSGADTVLSAIGKLQKQVTDNLATLTSHTSNTSNPHSVTKAQVGLANVDNTSDVNKPVSTATQTALNAKEPTIAAGTTAQYWRGDKSWQPLNPAAVGALPLSGGTISGTLTISGGSPLVIDGPAGTNRVVRFFTGGSTRWVFGASSAAEGGSNAGSDLFLNRYNDSGAYVDTTFSVNRATGAIGTSGSVTVGGDLTVTGNLTLNGSTTTVNSSVTTLDDPVLTLGGDTAPAVNDGKDRGIEFRWHNGTSAKVGFFGFDRSTGRLTFIPDATNASEVFSGTVGTIEANLQGNVTGTASAASAAPWSGITGTPTTRSGYGITDAEPTITAGTTGQYWRGDKTWQTLNAATVGALPLSGGTLTDIVITAGTTGGIANPSGGQAKFEVRGAGTSGDAAFMAFHRPGICAAYFGLDTDNQWKVGGWSSGNLAYTLHHSGNFGNINNTSDLNKPISTATQTALNAKEPTISAGTTAQYWRGDKTWQTLNKGAVGLANVDNTSDANKPISTATQTALDAKADASSAATLFGVQTLASKTLSAPVIQNPTEGYFVASVGAGGTFDIDLSFGPAFEIVINGSNPTIRLPAPVSGKRIYVDIIYNGAFQFFFVPISGQIRYANTGAPPTQTSVANRRDKYMFTAGVIGSIAQWYVTDLGRSFVNV